MAFAALISAYHDAEDGDAQLRALLPMAGRTLLEHQVRRAKAAGASHIVVLVERMPASLNVALDRLRRDGIGADVARTPAEAADRFHPEEDVLLVADGLVAAPDCFEAMAARKTQTLLVVADIPDNEGFERVDANRRWAGLALTDAATLKETTSMLGEWDLQSTLMRKIVQSNPNYLPIDGEGGAVADARDAVVLAERSASSRDAGRAMLARNRRDDDSWPERFLFAPFVSLVAPYLLDKGMEAIWLRIGALLLAVGGAVVFWFGWLWAGLAMLLISGPLAALASRIDMARLRDRGGGWETRFGKGVAHGTALMTIGSYFTLETANSLWILSSILAVIMLVFADREMSIFRKTGEGFGKSWPWLATSDAAICFLPLFAITGLWQYWPIAIAIYAALSLVILQNMVGKILNGEK